MAEKKRDVSIKDRWSKLGQPYKAITISTATATAIAITTSFIMYYNIKSEEGYGLILSDLLVTFLTTVVLVPLAIIIFRLIFNKHPANKSLNEYYSQEVLEHLEKVENPTEYEKGLLTKVLAAVRERGFDAIVRIPPLPIAHTDKAYIEQSNSIAEKIYDRSGVYLLLGCLIAVIGVVIFSVSSNSKFFFSPDEDSATYQKELYIWLLLSIPRISLFLFIEFIALFFLKQHKAMLEEYRYYEAIKRKRQDTLAFMELVKEHKDNPEVLKIIDSRLAPPSIINKLSNGETTELIESHKILNQEFDITAKLSEILRAIKNEKPV